MLPAATSSRGPLPFLVWRRAPPPFRSVEGLTLRLPPVEVAREYLSCASTFKNLLFRAQFEAYSAIECWFSEKSYGSGRFGQRRSHACPEGLSVDSVDLMLSHAIRLCAAVGRFGGSIRLMDKKNGVM